MKPITFPKLEEFESVQAIKQLVAQGSREKNFTWALSTLFGLIDQFTLPANVHTILDLCTDYPQHPIRVNDARKIALQIHKLAREEENLATKFMYRALGHTIATLHVHTHAYGMTLYALKAYHQLGYDQIQLQDVAQDHKKRLEAFF